MKATLYRHGEPPGKWAFMLLILYTCKRTPKGEADERTPAERRASMSWAQRLKRVFGIDLETCPACGGAVRIIACIEDPLVIEKILNHLDEKGASAEDSRRPPCRAPPQADLFD